MSHKCQACRGIRRAVANGGWGWGEGRYPTAAWPAAAAPALTQMTDTQPVRTAGQSVHRHNKGNLKTGGKDGGVTGDATTSQQAHADAANPEHQDATACSTGKYGLLAH